MWADIQTEVMEDSAKNFVKETKSLSKKIGLARQVVLLGARSFHEELSGVCTPCGRFEESSHEGQPLGVAHDHHGGTLGCGFGRVQSRQFGCGFGTELLRRVPVMLRLFLSGAYFFSGNCFRR